MSKILSRETGKPINFQDHCETHYTTTERVFHFSELPGTVPKWNALIDLYFLPPPSARQHGRVVRVLDIKSVGPRFDSHSEHYMDLFHGSLN